MLWKRVCVLGLQLCGLGLGGCGLVNIAEYPESANAAIGLWMKVGYTTYKHKTVIRAATKNEA